MKHGNGIGDTVGRKAYQAPRLVKRDKLTLVSGDDILVSIVKPPVG